DYFTDAISAKGVWILQRLADESRPAYLAEQGEVLVAEKVVGFKKIKMGTLENVGSGEVELPQQERQTTAAWLTIAPETLERVSAPSRTDEVPWRHRRSTVSAISSGDSRPRGGPAPPRRLPTKCWAASSTTPPRGGCWSFGASSRSPTSTATSRSARPSRRRS